MSDGVVVVRAGWGEKEGKIFKTWKRRFFVLRSATPAEAASAGCTHTLLYYKKLQQATSGYVCVVWGMHIRARCSMLEN